MRLRTQCVLATVAVTCCIVAGCGGSGIAQPGGPGTPSGARTSSLSQPGIPTPAAGTSVTTPRAAGTSGTAADSTTVDPAGTTTSEVPPVVDSSLAALVLSPSDAPFGFRPRSNVPVTKDEAAVALLGIPKLTGYLKGSDLQGAWATLYTREQPNSGLSSIAYRFATPGSANGFIEAIRPLAPVDYPASLSIERVQADVVGETSQMMRYRVPGARTLEYTWVRGALVGQVILRYVGDVESPDDVGLLVSLARKQDARMAAAG